LIIQHYAIKVINDGKLDEKKREAYTKLIARTIYGVVNAGRNVA
jgi:phosphoenolpyruvate carboxylase